MVDVTAMVEWTGPDLVQAAILGSLIILKRTMQKRDTLGKVSAKSLAEVFRCGECLHFKQHAHSSKEKPCSQEGVKAVGIAPKCFTPDVSRLATNSDQFLHVASMFQSFSYKERRILLGLLRATKKKGFNVGDKVYFKVGKDYISNYLSGYVMGYSSAGELMLIGSPDAKTRGSAFVAYLKNDESSFLTDSAWKKKRKELRESNKIHDPLNRTIKKSSVVDNYEPPTIDSVPSSWYTKEKEVKKKKKGKLSFDIS